MVNKHRRAQLPTSRLDYFRRNVSCLILSALFAIFFLFFFKYIYSFPLLDRVVLFNSARSVILLTKIVLTRRASVHPETTLGQGHQRLFLTRLNSNEPWRSPGSMTGSVRFYYGVFPLHAIEWFVLSLFHSRECSRLTIDTDMYIYVRI